MPQPSQPQADAQRTSDALRRRRRDAVDTIAERNRLAHVEARKQRQEADRRRSALRGPNDR
jgi:hypothetical protein